VGMAEPNGSEEPATRNGSRPQDPPPDESDEYATFEAFARRLVQVPKTELDAKRTASKT
jgi:hypothetical protein